MLIHTSKSLNLGQRKPRQYGPLSHVRYAVYRNADVMGIEAPKGFFAFDERVGVPIEKMSGLDAATNDAPLGWTASGGWINKDGYSSRAHVTFPYKLSLAKGTIITFQALTAVYLYAVFVGSDAQNLIQQNGDTTLTFRMGSVANTINVGSNFFNLSEHKYAFRWGDGFYSVFDGDIKNAVTRTPGTVEPINNLSAPGITTTGAINSIVYISAHWDDALSDGAIAQLVETPYALIMPVARPVYFDMAAGGGNVEFSTTISSVSAAIAALHVQRELAATIASVSSMSASLTVSAQTLIEFAATVASASGVAASLAVQREMSAIIASAVNIAASLDISGINYVQFAAALANESGAGASLAVQRELAALVASVSNLAADIDVASTIYIQFAATVASASAIEADLSVYRGMAATIASISAAQAEISVLREIRATIATISDITAALATFVVEDQHEIVILLSSLQKEVTLLSDLCKTQTLQSKLLN